MQSQSAYSVLKNISIPTTLASCGIASRHRSTANAPPLLPDDDATLPQAPCHALCGVNVNRDTTPDKVPRHWRFVLNSWQECLPTYCTCHYDKLSFQHTPKPPRSSWYPGHPLVKYLDDYHPAVLALTVMNCLEGVVLSHLRSLIQPGQIKSEWGKTAPPLSASGLAPPTAACWDQCCSVNDTIVQNTT